MPINPIQPLPPKQSGGLLGKVLGGIGGLVGTVAAPFTGGASLALGPALGAVGSVADPGKTTGGQQGPSPLQSMADRPGQQIARLNDAENALKTQLIPQDEYSNISRKLKEAKQAIMSRGV